MNSTATTLTFQSIKFDAVERGGQIWLRAAEIAQVLGYSRADKVTQIYDRNQDEFTPCMTQTLKLRVSGLQREIRLFSLRGAHLIAMFARTAVAKTFRRWVLDILDRQIDGLAARASAGVRLDQDALRDIEGLCTQAEFLRSWWERFGPGVRVLNRTAAGNVHDSFTHAAMASRAIVRALGLRSNREYAKGYPWEGGYMERRMYVDGAKGLTA